MRFFERICEHLGSLNTRDRASEIQLTGKERLLAVKVSTLSTGWKNNISHLDQNHGVLVEGVGSSI
jgi:hypothetical protein